MTPNRTAGRRWPWRLGSAVTAVSRRLTSLRRPRNRKRAVLATVLLAVFAADLAGLLTPIDRTLLAWRFSMLPRDASGRVEIVEIDAATFADLPVWPFPREYYARVIDQLVRAGVGTIVLDVDFSAHSAEQADDALAAAIARAGRRVILPAFVQRDSWSPGAAVRDVRPLQSLAENASIGAANVTAESDGRIWRYDILHRSGGIVRPSLAALAVGGSYSAPNFLVDYAISPETIPRISFHDLYGGRVGPGSLDGKIVIIGATAVELGDEFPVPAHGYQPGVVVQALAMESLLQRRALHETGWPITAAGSLLLFALAMLLVDAGIGSVLALCLTGAAAAFAGSVGIQMVAPVSLGLGAWMVSLADWLGFGVVNRLRLQAIQLFRQRMAMTYRRSLMRKVVEDSFDGIIATDTLGRIELFNDAASQMLGLTYEQVRGRPLRDLLPEAESGVRMADEDDHRPRELTLTGIDGRAITVEMLVSRSEVKPSRSPYERRRQPRAVYVYTFRDVSLRKTAEVALERAMHEAVQASQAKSDFIANMSHEFRTPLNAIIGFADILKDEILGPHTVHQYQEYSTDISEAGNHLLTLINDILDLSKIDAGKYALHEEVVDVPEIIRSAENLLRHQVTQNAQKLEIIYPDDLPDLRVDSRSLKQMILNLLSNAVKFTPDKGHIRLTVDRNEEQDMRISVSDDGIGIAAHEIPLIMQPFTQSESNMTRQQPGTGLGLSLVKKMVEMHEGRINLESRIGKGTTVTLTFPRERVIEI